MSPASKSKSKSKEKSATKPAKEQKGSGGSKPSSSSTGNVNTAQSAYNPNLGTFPSLETSQIDDITEEHSSSPHGTVSEYDTISNNESCSGESEDNNKDKIPSSTPPPVPSDRREKIRLKNEKKHQRQRERRAQELHERCCGYLMSRKLELLSQQLVNMGFSSERATLALILNEGRVEDSVSWLFDGNEDICHGRDRDRDKSRDCLKIDISEELSRVGELEAKYKCSKQEVERAVVGSEGDLAKAEESLRVQKLESVSKSELKSNEPNPQPQEKINAVVIAQRRSEGDFNYSRSDTVLQPNQNPSPILNPNMLVSRTDKRWSSAMPNQPAMPKNETFQAIGGEKINQHVGLREPVIMMQRPQPGKSSTVPNHPFVSTRFYQNDPSRVESLRSNMKLLHSQRLVGGVGPESQTSEHSLRHDSGLSHSLATPPSLGLFSSWRSGGSFSPSSQINWSSGGLMQEFDYNTIDWTLDTSVTSSSKSNGLLVGLSSLLPRPVPEPARSRFMGWQDGGVVPPESGSVGPYEWTSPFAGRDIFRLPRQFVTSPSP